MCMCWFIGLLFFILVMLLYVVVVVLIMVMCMMQLIYLDGCLDELVWVLVQVIDCFYEIYFGLLVFVFECIEVCLVYDDDFFYVGFCLWLKYFSQL